MLKIEVGLTTRIALYSPCNVLVLVMYWVTSAENDFMAKDYDVIVTCHVVECG